MIKGYTFLIALILFKAVFAQTIGTKVSFTAIDGKSYTGVVKEIRGNQFKIKYDGFNFESWLLNNQFSFVNTSGNFTNGQSLATGNLVGSKVSVIATDGKNYTGIIKEINGDKYKIKYDGHDFEAWLLATQFTRQNNIESGITVQPEQTRWTTNTTASSQDINSIFNFGKTNGWASEIQKSALNTYYTALSGQDKNKLVLFINQAKTSSAKFFVLKSLLAGDNFTTLQKFINQLNQFPESYQQERCLVTTRKSIIQQWQYSCSVTTVQTYLGNLCPRYAWEVKQINNYDLIANDPNHPMAEQQKMLLEKYGGAASLRGDYSGKSIGINGPLNDLVGKILGVTFYAQQITEPLPAVLAKVRSQLDRGIDVPLLIGFEGTEGKHFVLVMKYKYEGSGYQYLIYDPWDGVTDYVSQANLEAGSMAPLNNSWKISVDYYYPTYE